jgi:hypothetical protein
LCRVPKRGDRLTPRKAVDLDMELAVSPPR